MAETEPADGDVIVYAKLRDPDARGRLQFLLDDLAGVRVSPTICEVYTADWDEGAWEEEVERMEELIDPSTDTLIFWKVTDGKLTRTVIAGRLA
jgi:hypothetical protein